MKNLLEYYKSLPERIAPKQQMLEEIQRGCERKTGKVVTMTTVRNWVLYGIKPSRPEYVEVICEVTGIPKEYLWANGETGVVEFNC